MATYVAQNTVFPTVGEVVAFVAVRSGLVSTSLTDPVYEQLKLYVREQKGKDFAILNEVLNELDYRLQEYIAPPFIGNIVFETFRRVIDKYKQLIIQTRGYGFNREQLMEEKLIPQFYVPHAAWLLKNLNREPFDFLDLDTLLRAEAPLKVAFGVPLKDKGKTWMDLADLYTGKHEAYGNRVAEHDIDDRKKLIRKWGSGVATPDFKTCMMLLEELDWAKYSGMVFWVWIARFLQKIDKRYRILIADAIRDDAPIPSIEDLANAITNESDAISRMRLNHEDVYVLRLLSALLFYNSYRNFGDKRRVEQLLAEADARMGSNRSVAYYITWLKARYHLYCRDYDTCISLYEKAFHEGMYADHQAETMILPELAAIACKAEAKAVLKRVDSRMRFLRIYPNLPEAEVAQMRLDAFRDNFGAARFFVESFIPTQ